MNNSETKINNSETKINTNTDSNENETLPVVQKSKRGRKPNSLNKKTLEQNKLNAIVNGVSNLNLETNKDANNNSNVNNNDNEINENTVENNNEIDNKPVIKKRGRKPKGGKIIQNVVLDNSNKIEKPNIILHLKCFLKDLDNFNNNGLDNIDSYKFPTKNNLSYDVIQNEENTSLVDNNMLHSSVSNNTLTSFSSQKPNKIIHIINTNTTNIPPTYNPNYIPTYDNTSSQNVENNTNNTIINDNKEIYKKLKDLEMNLHLNNIQDKKSACFWCTCDFDNPPIYIPKHFLKESYHVYGCFCSPECGVAYLMNENIDSSTKFERFHLMNHIYAKIYNYTKNIKPAPSPFYMLEKYYGNLSINEYRTLIRNDRLFLIVDKPLTRIMPELHIDNEDFIINNKIISTNNFQINKKSNKLNKILKNNSSGEPIAFQ